MGAPMSGLWTDVAIRIARLIAEDAACSPSEQRLDAGQRASLAWISRRIGQHGVVLADEVGTGKTRIACALVHAVVAAGGRAAVVVPHGLMHQWKFESAALGEGRPVPKELTTLTAFFDVSWPDPTWRARSPDPDSPEWWLIAHGFSVPRVRLDGREWRVALPELVKACLAPKSVRTDRRTRSGKLLAQLQDKTSIGWKGMEALARAIAPRIRTLPGLQKRLDALPPLDLANGDSVALKQAFSGDGDGRRVSETLLGYWLGAFDLVVIDEAHKSRGQLSEEDATTKGVSTTVLTRLVERILRPTMDGRRLCMTATPMELELEQWLDLLQRAGCQLDDATGRRVVSGLHAAAQRAAIAPDERSRIDDLCRASRELTKVLTPYVTRRRRSDDPVIQRFISAIRDADGRPHPHRRIEQVRIAWDAGTEGAEHPHWFDVLFAAECMSQSARGLPLALTREWPRAIRDAYTKLSQGHVSVDLVGAEESLRVPVPDDASVSSRGKIERTGYWFGRLEAARRRVVEESRGRANPDAEHPRILAAVAEIERWTLQGEKVLVFGVFLYPLTLLAHVVNIRHALRMADARRPLAHAIHADRELDGILPRQLERLRSAGQLSGALATGGLAEVRRLLAESSRSYRNLRKSVRNATDQRLREWCTDPSLLGHVALAPELRRSLQDHLASFVLDDFLSAGSEAGLQAEERRERIDELADQFRRERLEPLLEDAVDETDGDEQIAAQREHALRLAMLDGHAGRQSEHARLLQGSTNWATRESLQAAFNRPGASPRVLLAQSQVGREGLNLHEACRVVIQFHAEWNPAILEQQIGRVDRKRSLWERRADEWLEAGCGGAPPMIEVRQLVFEGTYDAFKWDRVRGRQRMFDASLFGSLLSAEDWARVPPERRQDLVDAAPSFNPDRLPSPVSASLASVGDPVERAVRETGEGS